MYLCRRECARHLQPDHSAPPHSLQLGLWVHPTALWARRQEGPQLPRVHPVPAGTLAIYRHPLISVKFFTSPLRRLYLHSAFWCQVFFFSFFLGAAAGACTPGIRPKGQRQEWRHLLHGLQWHYGHHQTPHAHTVCGGEPCLSECVCVRGALTHRIICHHREYSDDSPKIIFIAGSSVVSVSTRLWHLPLFGVANC